MEILTHELVAMKIDGNTLLSIHKLYEADRHDLVVNYTQQLLNSGFEDQMLYYIYGSSLANLERPEEAIEAFAKAREHSKTGKFPDADYSRALELFKLEKWDESLSTIERAIEDKEGLFHEGVYLKGLCLRNLDKYKSALKVFEVLLTHKGHVIYPKVAFYAALCYQDVEEYRIAIDLFKSSIQSGLNFDLHRAWYEKGVSEYRIREFEACYKSAKRAVEICEEHYPSAYLYMSRAARLTGRFKDAVEYAEKAEMDGYGGIHEEAVFNTGLAYKQVHRYEEAYLKFSKLTQNTELPNYHDAWFEVASIYSIYEDYENVRKSIAKIEIEKLNSGFRGELMLLVAGDYYREEEFDKAIEAVFKSLSHGFPGGQEFYAQRSLCLLYNEINDSKKAHYHGLLGLNENPNSPFILKILSEMTLAGGADKLYQNRLNYIVSHKLPNRYFQAQDELFYGLKTLGSVKSSDGAAFSFILSSVNIVLPLDLDKDDRLRLAYIIEYFSDRPWNCFHIIDTLLDQGQKLSALDYLFYLRSACLVVEPIQELKWHYENREMFYQDGLEGLLETVKKELQALISSKKTLDGYVLDVEALSFISLQHLKKLNYTGLILSTLECMLKNDFYVPPISDNEITGLFSQRLLENVSALDSYVAANTDWRNLKRTFDSQDTINFEDLILNCRRLITSGEDYIEILSLICFYFANEEDLIQKRKLSLVMSSVILSHYLDHLKRPFHKSHFKMIIAETIAQLCTNQILKEIFEFGLIEETGLSVALNYFGLMPLKRRLEKYEKEKTDRRFEEILKEISNLN